MATLSVDGEHGKASVDIAVGAGGRLAQITVRGQELLIGPGGDLGAASIDWGSYPMAPWAGRVRNGRFRFFGEEIELELNQQDGDDHDPAMRHAIHGTVFTQPWRIEERAANAVTLSCPLTAANLRSSSLRNFGWTFGGVARQRIELLDGQLRCDLSVEVDHQHGEFGSDTSVAFLAEVGWHPWFLKPDSLSFHPDAMYERDTTGLPTGQLIAPAHGPWDDCFINTAPVTLHYNREVAALTLSSDCDHWVVYDQLPNATCVEPQSGPPDAFNIRPRLVTTTHPLRRTMNIAW